MADERPPPARVQLLRPLRLGVGGTPADVPGPNRRVVLALLALVKGRTVSIEHLRDPSWPPEMPESAVMPTEPHVPDTRAPRPGSGRLETCHGGYRLPRGRDEPDAARSRALSATTRATAQPDPGEACAPLPRRPCPGLRLRRADGPLRHADPVRVAPNKGTRRNAGRTGPLPRRHTHRLDR